MVFVPDIWNHFADGDPVKVYKQVNRQEVEVEEEVEVEIEVDEEETKEGADLYPQTTLSPINSPSKQQAMPARERPPNLFKYNHIYILKQSYEGIPYHKVRGA